MMPMPSPGMAISLGGLETSEYDFPRHAAADFAAIYAAAGQLGVASRAGQPRRPWACATGPPAFPH